MDIIGLAWRSVVNYCRLVGHWQLHLEPGRLGQHYHTDWGSYEVFRDTISRLPSPETPVVLVVVFRLKLIRSSRWLHWLFQRLCILTTPFWSGFAGFHIKLWMVDKPTGNYAGIYSWYGQDQGQIYTQALERVLRAVSVPGTVHSQIISGADFETFLRQHQVSQP